MDAEKDKVVTTEDLPAIAVNETISIVGKIVHVDQPIEINSKKGQKLTKQDCLLKDTKSTCRIVLWEENVGKLTRGTSIKLHNVKVKEYNGMRYLSLVADNSQLEELNNITDISDDEEDEPSSSSQLVLSQPAIDVVTGEIIAVQSICDYLSCTSCQGGTVHTVNPVIGKCAKCTATVKLSKCIHSKSARIVISYSNDVKYYLTIYSDQLEVLLDGEKECTEENLLMTSIHTFHYYTSTNIIKQVVKPQ